MKDQLEALVGQMVERGILFDEAVNEFEKKFIKRVLDRSNGNQSRAARLLGMHRNTLSRKIDLYKLDHVRIVRRSHYGGAGAGSSDSSQISPAPKTKRPRKIPGPFCILPSNCSEITAGFFGAAGLARRLLRRWLFRFADLPD